MPSIRIGERKCLLLWLRGYSIYWTGRSMTNLHNIDNILESMGSRIGNKYDRRYIQQMFSCSLDYNNSWPEHGQHKDVRNLFIRITNIWSLLDNRRYKLFISFISGLSNSLNVSGVSVITDLVLNSVQTDREFPREGQHVMFLIIYNSKSF